MASDDRWSRIGALLGGLSGGRPPVEIVCEGAQRVLGAEAVSVLLQGSTGLLTMNGSDVLAVRADEAQIVLGEGPVITAAGSDLPVLALDLNDVGEQWVSMSVDLGRLGITSAVAYPLRQGRARFGVLACYGTTTMALPPDRYADGLVLADVATELLFQHLAEVELDIDAAVGQAALASPVVQQAVGVLAERLGVDVTEAQVRLRALVFRHSSTLDEVASKIVNRQGFQEG